MNNQRYTSKWLRIQELIVTTLLGDIPTIALGPKLRNILYKSIFNRIGSKVYIQNGAEFLGSAAIELGDGVHIFKGVRLDALGHENNTIYLGSAVALERYVDIGSLNNTSIYIDDQTFIGPHVCIAGPGNIIIGKQCMIAAHTGIYANSHQFADPTTPIRQQGLTTKGIIIEDDCWLGHGVTVTVLDGVNIGQGSVIGAGSVVTRDIPPYSVALGTPARVIKHRVRENLVPS